MSQVMLRWGPLSLGRDFKLPRARAGTTATQQRRMSHAKAVRHKRLLASLPYYLFKGNP